MKNKKIYLIISLVIILIIILGLSIYFVTKGNKKSSNNKKDNPKIETEITDQNIIKKLNNQINILNFIKLRETNKYFYPNNYYGIYSQDKITSEEIDESDKFIKSAKQEALIMFLYYNNEFQELTTNHNFGNGLTSKDVKDEFLEIPDSKVELEFKKIFDTSIKHKSFRNCPTFIYDSKTKMYYGSNQCGEAHPNFYIDIYNEKYTKDTDYTYVYLRVGSYDNVLGFIYSDYQRKNKIIDDSTLVGKENAKFITSDNYTKFSQYKIAFVKKNNSYIFKKIEKV